MKLLIGKKIRLNVKDNETKCKMNTLGAVRFVNLMKMKIQKRTGLGV